MEIKEYCPNCHRHVLLEEIKGKDLLDPAQAILCVTIPLIVALGSVVGIRLIADILHTSFSPFTTLCISLISIIITFLVTLRKLIAFETNKQKSLGVAMYHLKCTCMPQNQITVIRPLVETTLDISATIDSTTALE